MDENDNLPVSGAQAEADIAKLDTAIRQLKIKYDRFFNGALPFEPFASRREIDRLIRRYTATPMGKYMHRFQFNTLVGRYNSLSELWGRNVRDKEEGRRRFSSPPGREQSDEQTLATCRVRGAENAEDSLRKLFQEFVQAREATGHGDRPVSYGAFVRGIEKQTEQLRERAGCAEIELRVVVHDSKVQLKARPGR